jgi:hypothetical protein
MRGAVCASERVDRSLNAADCLIANGLIADERSSPALVPGLGLNKHWYRPRLVSTQAQRGPHCAILALLAPGEYPATTASRLARRNSLNIQIYFLEDASAQPTVMLSFPPRDRSIS